MQTGILGFRRYDGFAGSIPQNFIDTNFPKCPMCGTTEPGWTLKDKMGVVNRVMFKCDKCDCILSATTGDISGADKLAITTGGLLKAIGGKKNSITYLKVEAAGNAQATKQHEGKEMPLEELQRIAKKL